MASVKITGDNPTLAHIALAIRESTPQDGVLADVTPAEVARAARRRDIRPRDGRVPAEAVSHIYMELRLMRKGA